MGSYFLTSFRHVLWIHRSSDYKKVPILTLKNENEDEKQTLKGSDEIVAALLQHPSVVAKWPDLVVTLNSAAASNKDGNKFTLDLQEFSSSPTALQWIQFAKNDLSSLLYPNLCPTLRDSYRAFGYVDQVPAFSSFQKLAIKSVGSFAMYMAASKVKRKWPLWWSVLQCRLVGMWDCLKPPFALFTGKRNITDAQESLREALRTLEEDGLGKGSKMFVSGESLPNLGDVTLFGTLRSLEGLPVHDRVLAHGDGSLQAWYGQMKRFM